jgi:hypothetical protein
MNDHYGSPILDETCTLRGQTLTRARPYPYGGKYTKRCTAKG